MKSDCEFLSYSHYYISTMPSSSLTILPVLLVTILVSTTVHCFRQRAGADTTYKLHVHGYKNGNPIRVTPMQQIEIEANHLPLSIHFKSRSSKLKLSQSHASNRPKLQRTSMEEPEILLQESRKMILKQLRDIFEPYQKTVTEVRPLSPEERKQVLFSSQENSTDEDRYSDHIHPARNHSHFHHNQHRIQAQPNHHQPQPSTESAHYMQSSSAPPTSGASSTPPQLLTHKNKSVEAADSEMLEDSYDSNVEDGGNNDQHAQQEEEEWSSPPLEGNFELLSDNSGEGEGDNIEDDSIADNDNASSTERQANGQQMGRSKSTGPVGDHLAQPSQQRGQQSAQLPSARKEMRELQILAARYMWAQYIWQYLKQYRQQQQQQQHQQQPLADEDSGQRMKSKGRKQVWPSTNTDIKRTGGSSSSGSFDLHQSLKMKAPFLVRKKYTQKSGKTIGETKLSNRKQMPAFNRKERRPLKPRPLSTNGKNRQMSRRSGSTISTTANAASSVALKAPKTRP